MTTHDQRPRVIGLTGGIGSGKTSAANLLGELGAGVIDTDVLAHQLTAANGAAMPAIAAEFGAKVVAGDGSLLRPAMREIVFSDPSARTRLEGILHPMSREAVTAILQAQSSRANRLAHADDVIDNQGDRLALQAQVIKLHARYLALVTRATPA